MTAQEQQEKAWEGGELLVAAIVQLLLVTVAYRIDRQKRAPLFSTSSFAIFCGLGVRLRGSILFSCGLVIVFPAIQVRGSHGVPLQSGKSLVL